jgi:hypothetical protein
MSTPPIVSPEAWERQPGRQEGWEDSPEGYPQTAPYQWWNLHDEYEGAA